MNMLDLEPYIHTRAMNLSGGNKRKLICAMSLLGCPHIEFLDEPTTGVDPVSRRSLFKMLKNLNDCSIILTTHRMDEAEALCDNIAIMINGRFVVYGNKSHLIQNYGLGYSIQLSHLKDIRTKVPDYLKLEQCFYKDSSEKSEKISVFQV